MGDHEVETDDLGGLVWPDFSVPCGEGDAVLCDVYTSFQHVAVSRMPEFEAFRNAARAAGHSV